MKNIASSLCVFCLLGASPLQATPELLDVFTDFESINTEVGEPFSIGAPPVTATFGGDAFAGVAGIGELYFSGSRAWMVNPGGTGVIEFETPASTVEFRTRLRTGANGASVYTAFDDFDQIIDTISIESAAAFQEVGFTGAIARIEVVNSASGAGQMNSIDNFGFTPVPEPTSATLAAVVFLSVATMRRRQVGAGVTGHHVRRRV